MIGFSSIRKCNAFMRILAYGTRDGQDDYLRMSESTSMESMDIFCGAVVVVFESSYLRGSNEEETTQIMAQKPTREFPR